MGEFFEKIRNILFSFLSSTFGQRATRFLGFFMTGFLALGDSRDEFFTTLDDAVQRAGEQKFPGGTPYNNDDRRAYVRAIMEQWAKEHGYRLTREFIHQAIGVAAGNLGPVAAGAGLAVTQLLGEEAGKAASEAIKS